MPLWPHRPSYVTLATAAQLRHASHTGPVTALWNAWLIAVAWPAR
ncbi:hypothetical protein HMPREF1978_00713 [Actinomyces graevenitzii F0530]|uniref:Uncharacterized protein n=1 Tax=Actinomyces graevenitzii F0530 TaxID=1321817 RepID=U1Q4K0_9ACTO|nr:hypothetical protein HMPREF1978_00713 [Actinomyces graevenitzii F0530]